MSAGQDRAEITSRKVVGLPERLGPAVRGVRSAEATAKISRHLERFSAWITDGLGHDRLSAVTSAIRLATERESLPVQTAMYLVRTI
ncbi:hypothetical protein [Nonomuraea insulae]|uniref:Mutator family transposase n=1 Tax=Nonomuraea insulae TaxID=1616787 RepID=A0ABW1CPV5_9ACTN